MFKGRFSSLAADALFSIADAAPYVLAQGGHAQCFSRGLFFSAIFDSAFLFSAGRGRFGLGPPRSRRSFYIFFVPMGRRNSFSLHVSVPGWAVLRAFHALALDYMDGGVPCSRSPFMLIKYTPLVPSRCAVSPHVLRASLVERYVRQPAPGNVVAGSAEMPPRTSAVRSYDPHQAPDQ